MQYTEYHQARWALIEEFISADMSMTLFDALNQEIQWRQDEITLFGKTHRVPRLQAWYGDPSANYHYSSMTLEPTPWTANLRLLKRQCEQICQAPFNAVLANLYRDGNDTVGWHSDNEPELGQTPVIASLSLGANRKFVMRHKKSGEKLEFNLPSGSLFIMCGNTQEFWQHSLPRTKKVTKSRINLTFRQVKI